MGASLRPTTATATKTPKTPGPDGCRRSSTTLAANRTAIDTHRTHAGPLLLAKAPTANATIDSKTTSPSPCHPGPGVDRLSTMICSPMISGPASRSHRHVVAWYARA